MGQGVDTTSSNAEIQELKDKLKESEKLIMEASRSWQEKLAETEARKREEVEQMKVRNTRSIRFLQDAL